MKILLKLNCVLFIWILLITQASIGTRLMRSFTWMIRLSKSPFQYYFSLSLVLVSSSIVVARRPVSLKEDDLWQKFTQNCPPDVSTRKNVSQQGQLESKRKIGGIPVTTHFPETSKLQPGKNADVAFSRILLGLDLSMNENYTIISFHKKIYIFAEKIYIYSQIPFEFAFSYTNIFKILNKW